MRLDLPWRQLVSARHLIDPGAKACMQDFINIDPVACAIVVGYEERPVFYTDYA
jgi:hypothetical protein